MQLNTVSVVQETRSKVFISYSRKDMAFVDRLEPGLKAHEWQPDVARLHDLGSRLQIASP